VVTAVEPQAASVAIEGSFDVDVTTTNAGTAPAGASRTRFFLSLDTSRDAGDHELVTDQVIDVLGVGAAATETVTVTVPLTATTGTFHVIACADAEGAVVESREDDNCRASAATVDVAP
jgi:hypothetical protein